MRKHIMILAAALFTTLLSQTALSETLRVQTKRDNKQTSIVSVTSVQSQAPARGKRVLRSFPYYTDTSKDMSSIWFEEYEINAEQAAPEILKKWNITKAQSGNYEVRTLVNQGPTSNRINLTIVGDGYTATEKDK